MVMDALSVVPMPVAVRCDNCFTPLPAQTPTTFGEDLCEACRAHALERAEAVRYAVVNVLHSAASSLQGHMDRDEFIAAAGECWDTQAGRSPLADEFAAPSVAAPRRRGL
jgi:hypothetical protein